MLSALEVFEIAAKFVSGSRGLRSAYWKSWFAFGFATKFASGFTVPFCSAGLGSQGCRSSLFRFGAASPKTLMSRREAGATLFNTSGKTSSIEDWWALAVSHENMLTSNRKLKRGKCGDLGVKRKGGEGGVKTIAKLSVNTMANLSEARDGSHSEKFFWRMKICFLCARTKGVVFILHACCAVVSVFELSFCMRCA